MYHLKRVVWYLPSNDHGASPVRYNPPPENAFASAPMWLVINTFKYNTLVSLNAEGSAFHNPVRLST